MNKVKTISTGNWFRFVALSYENCAGCLFRTMSFEWFYFSCNRFALLRCVHRCPIDLISTRYKQNWEISSDNSYLFFLSSTHSLWFRWISKKRRLQLKANFNPVEAEKAFGERAIFSTFSLTLKSIWMKYIHIDSDNVKLKF